MKRSAGLTLVCAMLLAAGCTGGVQETRDDLQVTRVVLYQNGVGYFERRGKFQGKELKLRVRPDQINDMLTSLTVLDLRSDSGVGSVSLPVEKSSSMVLGELPPQVRDQGGLQGVLQAFRGANIEVSRRGGGGISGQVVGVEPVAFADSGLPSSWRLTLLTADDDLVPVALDAIDEIHIGDKTLAVGLGKALDVALGEGDWKPTELAVRFASEEEHDVLMSYVVAMPTWKPAYRLIFGEEGKARLQGWAVIDNVSGEDWNNVQLSLTAGAPISFIVDLHTPRLPTRPDLTSRTYSGVVEAPPESVGSFGLGMSGSGVGGGGTNYGGFGAGDIGTAGRGGGGGKGYGKDATSLGDKKTSKPKLKPANPDVTGSLDRRIIRKVVNQHKREIKKCYERELIKDGSLGGKITIKWVIDSTGNVSSAQVSGNSMRGGGGQRVADCINASIRNWRFPAPKGGGVVQVAYPFVLTNGGGGGASTGEAFAGDGESMDSDRFAGSMEANASGAEVGSLFRYDIEVPVTVPDSSSALVPIINTDIEGEDVLLFDPSSGSSRSQKHPWRAARLTNSTAFVIERGPLTIYDEGTFVGEGITSLVDAGQTAFIPYSLESGVHIAPSTNYGSAEKRLATIVNGVITVESQALYEQGFTITNNRDEDVVVYLRVPRAAGYDLKDTGVETITQGEVYFAKVTVPALDEVVTEVVQASKSRRTITLYDADLNTVVELYIKDADADPKVKAALEELLTLKRGLGDLAHRSDTLYERQYQLRDRASDLRNNIRVLGKAASNAGLKREMVAKLGEVEKELTEIDRELVELGEKQYGLEVQLREKLQGITLE